MNELQRYKEALEQIANHEHFSDPAMIAAVALRPPLPVATLQNLQQALRDYSRRSSRRVNITLFDDASGTVNTCGRWLASFYSFQDALEFLTYGPADS